MKGGLFMNMSIKRGKRRNLFAVMAFVLLIACLVPSNVSYAGWDMEPNDTIQTASTFGPDDNGQGTISSTTDVDYFKFTVPSNNTVAAISLSGLQAGMDYDFDVRNSSNTLISQVKTSPGSATRLAHDNRREYYKNFSAGTYYVRVFTRNARTNRTYTLSVDLSEYGTTFQINVDSIAQKKSNWCWAAVAETLGKFIVKRESLGASTTTRDQLNCVGLIKHNNPNLSYSQLVNQGANDDNEFRRAVQYVADNNQYSNRFVIFRPYAYSVAQIHSRLFEYRMPIAIGISNNQTGSGYSGHYLIIMGIKASTNTIYIRDPYNTSHMNSSGGPAIARSVNYYDLVSNGYIPGTDNRTYQMTLE